MIGFAAYRLLTAVLLLPAAAPAPATKPGGPTVWMGVPSYDNGRFFRELFQQPDAWKEARSQIDALIYADHWLDRHFTDDELRVWFPKIREWGLTFELEVGAIKPWGHTGEKTFNIQRAKWDRFLRLGGKIVF